MPFLQLPTHRMHYRIDGDGPDRPWLLFSNSLGTDLTMWDAQMAALSPAYRILRYDTRGHGLSEAPPGPYGLADLGGDVVALLDALGIGRVRVCGLSIGGLTGQWLGLHAASRIDRLVVCATAARIGTAEGWAARAEEVRANGLDSLLSATAERWFTPEFRKAQAGVVAQVLAPFARTQIEGYAGCCAALGAADLRDKLAAITVPLLAIAGATDPVCAPLPKPCPTAAMSRFPAAISSTSNPPTGSMPR